MSQLQPTKNLRQRFNDYVCRHRGHATPLLPTELVVPMAIEEKLVNVPLLECRRCGFRVLDHEFIEKCANDIKSLNEQLGESPFVV